MREAEVDGQLVVAGPDTPELARCPTCGCEVQKRGRRRTDGQVTWYYRHKRGAGDDCPRRYWPAKQPESVSHWAFR